MQTGDIYYNSDKNNYLRDKFNITSYPTFVRVHGIGYRVMNPNIVRLKHLELLDRVDYFVYNTYMG